MARLIRTESAKADMSAIADYISVDNPLAAERWLDEINQTLALLAEYPHIGEQVDHLAPGIRRFCVGNYLLFYRPLHDGIELRRILHGARRIEDLFR
jgi:toxin ParE1/3/4